MASKDIIHYLDEIGVNAVDEIVYNPDYARLFEEETRADLDDREKVVLTDSGAVNIDTGVFTGRSPKDKYFVYDSTTANTLWWNDGGQNKNDNKPITPGIWQHLKNLATEQLSGKRLFVIDAWCGATEESRLGVRFVTEVAWQAHFVKNMFIPISPAEEEIFTPDFLVINASKCTNPQWQEQGLNSENFVAFNMSEKIQLIGGTWYGGEMKKGLFSVMNYLLPQADIASMHCSANVGNQGDVALFFGLSGTGKTTLSTDPERRLIGDDEHGWDESSVFNFEGGCYAKTYNLSQQQEPEIFAAIRRNALLENVVVNRNGIPDYSDKSKTENTRVSYPLSHIDNIIGPPSRAGHASNIIFLTADAFGVLPPVSRLTEEQMQYHFLSGFTAKLAGTERGITHPQPTFSACFGAAFLTLHPTAYADILLKKVKQQKAKVWLVNTGWNGQNSRISLKCTRQIISAILSNELDKAEFTTLPIFNLQFPLQLDDVETDILDPRRSWSSEQAWHDKAVELGQLFKSNFTRFTSTSSGTHISHFGPEV